MSGGDKPTGRGKDGRFSKGTSGNPKGRPPKPPRIVVPDQMRRDLLTLASEKVEIKTEKGVEKLTRQEVVLRRIVQGAMAGKPTCLKLWMQLYPAAVGERFEAHPAVRLTALLRQIGEQPSREVTLEDEDLLDAQIDYIKKLN